MRYHCITYSIPPLPLESTSVRNIYVEALKCWLALSAQIWRVVGNRLQLHQICKVGLS